MKKKKPEPAPKVKPISGLDEFKAQYGNDYQKIISHPAFLAGMQLLDVLKLRTIASLQDEDIEKNSREILADFRGYLQHVNDLVTLNDRQDFRLPIEEPDIYLSPEQVGEHEQLMQKHRDEQKKSRYGN